MRRRKPLPPPSPRDPSRRPSRRVPPVDLLWSYTAAAGACAAFVPPRPAAAATERVPWWVSERGCPSRPWRRNRRNVRREGRRDKSRELGRGFRLRIFIIP